MLSLGGGGVVGVVKKSGCHAGVAFYPSKVHQTLKETGARKLFQNYGNDSSQ